MDEKKQDDIALFRFGVISEFFSREFCPGEKSALLREKVSQTYSLPHSARTSIASATLKDWMTRYRRGGFEALKPKERSDQGQSRTLPPELAELIIALKEENPSRSATIIARELELAPPIGHPIPPHQRIVPSTIHRLLVNQGLVHQESPAKDRRHFEYAYPGELYQSDCLHGPRILVPQTGRRRKTYLYAFLPPRGYPATRVVPHAQFYFDEGLLSFEHAFKQALLKKGVPLRLYCDNGSVYRSHHLQVVCASLGIILIHSKAYVPQGKGKAERFFRTLRMQFLNQFDMEKIKGLEDLNSRLWAWHPGGTRGEYHRTIHSSLNETPLDKWMRLVGLRSCRVQELWSFQLPNSLTPKLQGPGRDLPPPYEAEDL
ncbi:MAG: hypothetical protein A3G93_08975 [Nitrospinae bacterium RIFCSPLOWO2_12_FULL_45_22]|nr:MAG: hypothetical protein A3G93_08975 [Nitrospinae bacterium RIFCSPLOWO2_12_FULL_45_22]